MRVIEDRDVEEVMDEIYSEAFNKLVDVFGREEACQAVEDTFDEVEYDYLAREIESDFTSLVRYCIAIRNGEPLTSDEMIKLGLDYETCKEHDIETLEELDEDGNVCQYELESEAQMKLFPEMERGLPPMKIRKAVA